MVDVDVEDRVADEELVVLVKADRLLDVAAGEENTVEDIIEDSGDVVNSVELVLKVERLVLKTLLNPRREGLDLVGPLNGVDEDGDIFADEFACNHRPFAVGKEADIASEPLVV